ncbi:STAS-like domain-containing protein [Amycolatopsis lurida]
MEQTGGYLVARKQPWIWEVRDLKGPWRATRLLEISREHQNRDLIVDLTNTRHIYPNGAVPFAATLAHLNDSGADIDIRATNNSPLKHILDPLTVDTYERLNGHTLTNSVWRYDDESEAQRLTNMFMDVLTDQVHCEEGVIDSITWCLYEVLDNVFQHSHADSGFVMMQLHRAERRCVIAVGDTGIGIQKSLALTHAAELEVLRDPGASINHSMKKGVTSKGGQNQGNGLFGLRRAVEINGGQLFVRSGWGIWRLLDGVTQWDTDRSTSLPDIENHQATLVDWQLDCSTKVRIDEALGSKFRNNDFLETIEDDEGHHRVSVIELEESLGSRKLGAEIRTRLENYLRAGAQFVVLDFKGVGVVSSSFADEVLAKLALTMGELEFRRRVFVDSASATNRSLIETAIALRLESGSSSQLNGRR